MTDRKNLQVRTFAFELDERAVGDGVPVVVSSDAVVEMPDGPEVLLHSPEAIDLQRAPLPIIATHRSGQVNVGVIDNLSVVGGKLRGMATFGTRPEAAGYREDVLNRTIRSVSVGYARVKGHIRKDGVLHTTRWMPTHTALVAEPADINAGFFRELAELPALVIEAEPVSPPAAPAASERKTMTVETQAAAGSIAEVETRAAQSQQAERAQPTGDRAVEMERSRRRGIENICKANKIDDNLREYWIGTGLTIEQLSDDVLKVIEERGRNTPKSEAAIGLSEREAQNFSFFRAIRAVVDKNWNNAGFELEASRAVAQKLGRMQDPNKFFVPFEVQRAKRDVTVATSTAGGFLVATNNVSFIEIMRNRSVVYNMGATRLSGLVGNVTVPKQTAAGTAVWLANEASTVTESQQTFAQMSLSPKTVGGYTEISRNLMLQSSPDAEGIVTSDLAAICALAVDVGALRGAGSGGEPAGIVGTSGVGSVTGTSLAAGGVLEFQSDVAGGNLLSDNFGYVTTPAVAALLMARPELPSTGTTRLWQGSMLNGTMFGQKAMSSNQMSSATMLAGDFSKVVIGEWGVLEIEVNPYANFQAGIVGVRALLSIDVGVRYGGAFSYASSIT
jgi:HK97 family phage major capsid protein